MKLKHHLHVLCNRNRDGSFVTQANRKQILLLCARDLKLVGYNQINSLRSLKPKHIEALVKHWKEQGLAASTIKNRMSNLRWVAEKINRPYIIKDDNGYYDIEGWVNDRSNKALPFTSESINTIRDKYVQSSAILIKAFGLRRKESIKICPKKADAGDKLKLRRSWCKGGRAREIEIRSDEQRQALDHAKSIAGNGPLISPYLTYKKQLKVFEKEMCRVGLGRSNGARHAYAQDRYATITGWVPSIQGGPKYKNMSVIDKATDREARKLISSELGVGRLQSIAPYLDL